MAGGGAPAPMKTRQAPALPLARLGSFMFSCCGAQPVVEAAGERPQAALTGTWKNDLGSTMVIGPPDAAGSFTGIYHTAVKAAKKPICKSPLYGSQHLGGAGHQPTFGFTVNWTFSDSITVFAGQHFVDAKGKETLETTWLLREQVDSRADDWEATRVGKNVFTRVESSQDGPCCC